MSTDEEPAMSLPETSAAHPGADGRGAQGIRSLSTANRRMTGVAQYPIVFAEVFVDASVYSSVGRAGPAGLSRRTGAHPTRARSRSPLLKRQWVDGTAGGREPSADGGRRSQEHANEDQDNDHLR